MAQLTMVLRLAKTIDVDYLVLERLLVVSRSMPLEVVCCLRLLCEGSEQQWEISSRLDEIKKILSAVLKSKKSAVREEAIDLAEFLTAKGFRCFDDLLDDVYESSS
jgi:hypothetical protein